MGTGPRGGKRVREAAAAAAAAAAGGANATDEERIAAGTAAAAPSEWHARDPAERPSSKPKGNPTPPPKAAGAVDPEDVDRKSSLALTKKGFAAGAVARACASVRPTADDEKTSFNEQKRRRIAAVTSWLLTHAELWELPREQLAEAKRARGEADDENRHQEQETRGSDESLVDEPTTFSTSTRASALKRWSNRAFFRYSKRTSVSRRRKTLSRRQKRTETETSRVTARRIASAPANRCA
jgi:hypothetical protein